MLLASFYVSDTDWDSIGGILSVIASYANHRNWEYHG